MRWVVLRGVAGSSLLTLGGLCYARVASPSWVTDSRLLSSIRGSHGNLGLGLTTSALGLVLLTSAWWALRRFAHDRADGVASVRIAAVCWSVPLLIAPPLFSGDGWSYVATGYLTGKGLSPYTWTPSVLAPALQSGVNARWLHTPSPYGPLALGWGGVVSRFTSDPWLLLVGYRVLALIGLAVLAWAVPRLARRCGRDAGEASWLVVASPFVIAHGIGGVHNDLLMVALAAAALAVTRQDRWWWGAVLAGSAAAVKVPGGLIAVGVVLLSLQAGAGLPARIRRTVEVGLVGAGTLALLGLLTGVGTGWISTISGPTSLRTPLSVTYRLALVLNDLIFFGSAHPDGPMIKVIEGVGALVVVGLAAALLLFGRTGVDRGALAAVAGLMFAVTVLSPVEHYWYFLWSLPLLACVPLRLSLHNALVVLVAVLGLSAVADPSLRIGWLTNTATYAVACLPLLTLLTLVGLQARSRLAVRDHDHLGAR